MVKRAKTYSIYSIRNKVNGKRYIGLSYHPEKRIEQHRNSKSYIGNAIHKYGWYNFDKRILKTNLTLKQAQKAERFYIAKYKSLSSNGYNLCIGGNARGTFITTKITKERLRKSAMKSQNTPKRKRQLKASTIKQQAESHNMTTEEWKETNKLETRICACGCKRKFKCKKRNKQKYLHGHNKAFSNHKHSTKTKKLISKNSGMHDSETVTKQAASQLGISVKEYRQSQRMETRRCACGCKQTFKCKKKSNKIFISGHNGKGSNNGKWIPRETRNCACGCKQTFECLINSKKRFIRGHNAIGNPNARKAALARWHK